MNRQSNNDPSTHFKMYKGGKKWVFAGLTAVTLLTASGSGDLCTVLRMIIKDFL